jgi:hypothetical protein
MQPTLTCKICFEPYNQSNRRPTTLMMCSHTYCLECVSGLQTNLSVMLCPICRDIVIDRKPNYAILELLDASSSSSSSSSSLSSLASSTNTLSNFDDENCFLLILRVTQELKGKILDLAQRNTMNRDNLLNSRMINEYFRSKNVTNQMKIEQIQPYRYKISFLKRDFDRFRCAYDLIFHLRAKLNYFSITQFLYYPTRCERPSTSNKRTNENIMNNQSNAKKFCFNGNETILVGNIPPS